MNMLVLHESFTGSDHRPLALVLNFKSRSKRRYFKYEAKWDLDHEWRDVFIKSWERRITLNSGQSTIEAKMQALKPELKKMGSQERRQL